MKIIPPPTLQDVRKLILTKAEDDISKLAELYHRRGCKLRMYTDYSKDELYQFYLDLLNL